jgi:hypothetical protein
MDPVSLVYLRRVSFLLPLSVDRLQGEWSDDHTRLEFRLTQFPEQPGATYEALFAGLRTADGELYNRGPYEVLFTVRGTPDLLPMRPDARIESREFCRRIGRTSGACNQELVLQSTNVGLDSLAVETRCADCPTAERRDLFRRFGGEIQWLGFDLQARSGAPLHSVRWREPPALVGLPPRRGAILESPPQTSPDGTALLRWTSRDAGTDTPSHLVVATVIPVQIAFSQSRVIEIDYEIAMPGVAAEHRTERWWLYPGVGLVRRESRVASKGDTAPRLEIDSYEPPLTLFSTR